LALDEPKDTDDVFDMDGFKLLVDKELMLEVDPITLDFSHFGFQFDCALRPEDACSLPNT